MSSYRGETARQYETDFSSSRGRLDLNTTRAAEQRSSEAANQGAVYYNRAEWQDVSEFCLYGFRVALKILVTREPHNTQLPSAYSISECREVLGGGPAPPSKL